MESLNHFSGILLHFCFLCTNYPGLFVQGTIQTESCGQLTISGNEVRFPWAAVVQNSELNTVVSKDAAVILSPHLVAMNANRFKVNGKIDVLNISDYTVSTNLSLFGDSHEKNPNVQTVEISQIRIHPGYNKKPWTEVENDLALVHLKTPLKFDSNIHAICIPTPEIVNSILLQSSYPNFQNETSVVVSGWNRLQQSILFLKLNVNSKTICNRLWENYHTVPYENRFCAGVALGNSHETCIHRDTGVAARLNATYYFMGFVNNFYSDRGQCNNKTVEFICKPTDPILKFIEDNIRCGPKQFTCSSGTCIPLRYWYDGKLDCKDGSDENNAFGKVQVKPEMNVSGFQEKFFILLIVATGMLVLLVILCGILWKTKLSNSTIRHFKITDEDQDPFFQKEIHCDGSADSHRSPQHSNLINVTLFPWNLVRDKYEILSN